MSYRGIIDSREIDFYVYVYVDPLTQPTVYDNGMYKFKGEPFYVGKGHGNRYTQCGNNEQVKQRCVYILNCGQQPLIYKFECMNEDIAFQMEKDLITVIGRYVDDGPLYNRYIGGGGNVTRFYSDVQIPTFTSDDLEIM